MKKTEYVGYIIRDKSLNNFFNDLNSNKENAINVAKENIAKNAAEEYEVLERTTKLTSQEIKSNIINKILSSQERIKKGFEVNFKWSYHLKFNVFTLGNDILINIESDNLKSYMEFFEELGYEEYSYHTGINKPATVCQIDWVKREKDWRKVGLLSEENKAPNCFIYQMVQWSDYEKDMLNNKFFEKLISKDSYYFN
jgi:hypothetical protein